MSLQEFLRTEKQWVRDCINQRNSESHEDQIVAKEAVVCKSGTHRSVAAAHIFVEMLRKDDLAFYKPKHLSRNAWAARNRCWWCANCALDNPLREQLFDRAYELWKTV